MDSKRFRLSTGITYLLTALLATGLITSVFPTIAKASPNSAAYAYDVVDHKYYEFVPWDSWWNSGWDYAIAQASSRTYLGLPGRIATPLNSNEQAAINTVIGSSDQALLGGRRVAGSDSWNWVGVSDELANFATCSTQGTWYSSKYICSANQTAFSNWSSQNSYFVGKSSTAYLTTRSDGWFDESNVDYTTGYVVEYDVRDLYNLQSTKTSSGATLTWSSLTDLQNATVQKSFDGQTWAVIGTTKAKTFSITGIGLSFYARVVTDAGASSNIVNVTTGGLAPQSVKFVSSSGRPLSGGSLTWAMANGSARSSITYGLLSDGTYSFPAAPGGIVNLQLTNGVMPDGALVTGSFQGILCAGNVLIIRMPGEPNQAFSTVTVLTPDGLPVWGAKVTISNLMSQVEVSGATFSIPSAYDPCYGEWSHSGCYIRDLQTDINGSVTFWGYFDSDPETNISVVYDDGVVTQTPEPVVPVSSSTVVSLDFMPFVVPFSSTVVATGLNVLTPVTISLASSPTPPALARASHASQPIVNRQVQAILPTGSRACPGQVLTASTNSQGRATFKVCATQNGEIKFKTPGVLIPGSVSFFIAGTAAQPVLTLHGTTPARGAAFLAWGAPKFTGGVPILSYQVTISAPGKRTVVASTPKLQLSVTGLSNATRYTVTVRAVTRLGAGSPASTVISVA